MTENKDSETVREELAEFRRYFDGRVQEITLRIDHMVGKHSLLLADECPSCPK
jgi:hypothetical protein